jgi:geranylgeranyl diphosphate synthase type II
MGIGEQMKQRAVEIEEKIKGYLPKEQGHQRTIFEAMNYSVLNGGKRLRPMIMEETYRLFGGSGEEIYPFMAAIEMIHSSSLVHDDLPAMDNDEYRRGRKTTWTVYGEDMGILAGDALMIYAFETAAKAFEVTKYPARVGNAVKILANKTGIYGMIGGQTVDVELTGKPIVRDKLDFIYRLKTGALLEAAMMIGAVLAGAGEEELKTAEQIAADVGMAFQIQDDILDMTGDSAVIGKPVMSDEKNQKTTYPVLVGLEESKALVKSYTDHAVELLHTLSGENRFLEDLFITLITRES